MRTHDGFYMRLGLGFGYSRVTSSTDDLEWTAKGSGLAMDMLFGGTIANMVAIGGGLVFTGMTSPEYEGDSFNEGPVTDDTGSITTSALGPFVDVFFGPNSGGHAGAMFALGGISLNDENEDSSSGWGLAVFGGYDFWVSDQWSLGVNARYLRVAGTRDFTDLDLTVRDVSNTFSILFNGLFN